MIVSVETPKTCPKCNSTNLIQDEDVLDTWFSSWLWPFSTMGWPEKTAELQRFYPTNTLVTAADIIFFWVARMIMSGLEFMKEVPFRDVYFNGVIRDNQGRKMSKSLGNGIDPLEMVDKYSADAVRYSLLMLSSEGQDINLSESAFEIGRNFANKLWNAFRFLAMNLEDGVQYQTPADLKFVEFKKQADLADRWILSRFVTSAKKLTESIDNFKLNDAILQVHSFFWGEFCDWYLELIKPRLYGNDPAAKQFALSIALTVFRGTLKMLHPFIPFITEEVWNNLKAVDEPDLIVSDWVKWSDALFNPEAEAQMKLMQEVIGAVRNIRGEMNVPPAKKADVVIKGVNRHLNSTVQENIGYLQNLARVENVEIGKDVAKPRLAASAVVDELEIFVPLAELIDINVERTRLDKEIERLGNQLMAQIKKISNADFVSRAPEDVIAREKQKKVDWELRLEKLKLNRASLEV